MRSLLMIAGPLAAAYLAELAMSLTTKSIVGQLGYRELAGSPAQLPRFLQLGTYYHVLKIVRR